MSKPGRAFARERLTVDPRSLPGRRVETRWLQGRLFTLSELGIYATVRAHTNLTLSRLARLTGHSRNTLRPILDSLCSQGRVEVRGTNERPLYVAIRDVA